DQLAVLRGLTKWAGRIEHPTQTAAMVNEAFRQLQTGRPRPVALEVPPDVLALETEVELTVTDIPQPIVPDPRLIEHAAALLGAAQKPLIMVGSGADDAGEALLAVAERLQAPVVASTSGRGIISDHHPLNVRGPVGHH